VRICVTRNREVLDLVESFTDSHAQTSWTRPAVASIFTGLLPQQHGTVDKKDVMPESATTIAELLTGAGYESAAIVSNGNVSQVYGFSQGFSYYKYLQEIEISEQVVRSDDVNQAMFSWLDEFRGTEPFFLYVHTVDPHLPYAPLWFLISGRGGVLCSTLSTRR